MKYQMRMRHVAVYGLFGLLLGGCGPSSPPQHPAETSLKELRRRADDSERGRLKALWLLAELLEPHGDPANARRARAELETTGEHGMYEDLARGIDDAVHGRLHEAPKHYLNAAKYARKSTDPDAELIANFAVRQAKDLSENSHGLWEEWQHWILRAIDEPRALGWRAREALVGWWAEEAWANATQDIEAQVAAKSGCLGGIRLAGPFGSGATVDSLRSHGAEDLGPWPQAWPPDPVFGQIPRLLDVEQKGCHAFVDEPTHDGVFYAEATFTLERQSQTILSVDNALAVWVDDELVLDRSLREWGSWTRVGVGLQLEPGPHRVVSRLTTGNTSVRLLTRDGRPLPTSKPEPQPLPSLSKPRVAFEANALRRFVHEHGVRPVASPLLRYVIAYLTNVDGESEAGTMVLEPLVKEPKHATGTSLSMAATLVESDPIYEAAQTEDLIRELHAQALKRDPNLWASELNGIAQIAKSRGLVDAVDELKKLTKRYQQVPPLLGALASVYGELGWTPEYRRTVKLQAERFPDDVEGLYAAAQVYDEEGADARAEALYQKIRQLDPDSEIAVNRAIERHDYARAISELKRLGARRPNRKDIKRRVRELRLLQGKSLDRMKLLKAAVDEDPESGQNRLRLADALYAAGNPEALSQALVDAIEAGADTEPIKSALDLIQGVTELEPYRLDGRQVIAEYEAKGEHLPGTAARVLDYMAAWVLDDGSSRYLEHEIIRIQSEEAINRFAEQQVRGQLVLKMRVIKKDGSILEPETVAGKPTVTFPHLELGDYIETEQIFASGGSINGTSFDGPGWFFREQNVAYARSEFVLVAPSEKKLDIEVTGDVPAPMVEKKGHYTTMSWRVDNSPAAPEEPHSVPASEYLPSVKVSWGINLERHLRILSDRVADTTPVDPRIVRIADRIVQGIPAQQELARARALYRWILDNVQEGEESDGRRVIVGKRGNRWQGFITLCRALDIPVRWALAKNRLAAPPNGPASRASQYSNTVLRVGGKQQTWLTLGDKYSPFGYIPVEVRGMPGFLLGEDEAPQPVTIPDHGESDRLEFAGKVALSADGGALLELDQTFGGRFGAGVREALSELGERQAKDAVESNILGSNFRGARLVDHHFSELDQLDVPLTLHMQARMAHFALNQGKTLRLAPPYSPNISQFATLPSRQTPVLMSSDRNWRILLQIQLPEGARVQLPEPRSYQFGEHEVTINDRVESGVLILDRKLQLSAGRVAPKDYPRFVTFSREADSALTREILIEL